LIFGDGFLISVFVDKSGGFYSKKGLKPLSRIRDKGSYPEKTVIPRQTANASVISKSAKLFGIID